MAEKKSKKELLRQMAEKPLSKKPEMIREIPPEDIRELIHELQVHQTELEMQNEELRKAQAEIEQSRSKYTDLYDFSPVSYVALDKTGMIVEANLTAARLLNVERGKLIGGIFSAFVAPEFGSVFRNHCQKVLSPQSKKERCELKLIKKDGTFFYASLESIAEADRRGLRSALTNITDQKRAEEELRTINQELNGQVAEAKRTEEALRKLAGELNEKIKEVNCLYSVCYNVERQHADLEERLQNIVRLIPSGWQYSEIACAQIVLKDEQHKTDDFRETEWKQASNILVHDEIIGTVEVYYLEERPEGDEGPFLKEERNLLGAIAIELGEMIGHIRSDRALRSASLYARSLIEASPDPFVTIRADGKIMDVNKATELATGFSREFLIGSDFSNYFTEPGKAREVYKKVFLEESVTDYPLAIRHTSGRVIEVLYNATVYRNEDGDVEGVFAAARDITARNRAEEALQASEERLRHLSSQLLRTQEQERRRIAREVHDGLGQMLTAIKFRVESFSQEMDQGNLKGKAKLLETFMPVIQESIEEARRIQMDLRPPMLDDLGVLSTLSWFSREFVTTYPAIHIEKEINIEENEIPESLKTVIYRISQEAFNNLGKHSKAHLVRLSLGKKEDRIELLIQDNGRGFNLDKGFSAGGRGQGMGLSSMRERAELSGGSFSMKSIKGKGTTIQVSWRIEH